MAVFMAKTNKMHGVIEAAWLPHLETVSNAGSSQSDVRSAPCDQPGDVTHLLVKKGNLEYVFQWIYDDSSLKYFVLAVGILPQN